MTNTFKPAKRLNRLGTYLFVRVRKRPQRANTVKRHIDLSVGDPDQGVVPGILKQAFAYALRQKNAGRYPVGRGSAGLRRAIAGWMRRRHGVRLDPDREIAALPGSKEGLAHFIHALCDPGDTLLTGSIAYPVYGRAASLAGARVKLLDMTQANGYWLDYSRAPRAKALVINYPHNPTGAIVENSQVRDLVRWAARRDVFIVSDAAYSEMYFEGSKPPGSILEFPGAIDRAVEFHSFSKSFGLPGLRLGWVCGNNRAIGALLKLKDTYDSGVSNYIQGAGEYLLTIKSRDAELERLRQLYGRRREVFESSLARAGFSVFRTGATFYVWVKSPYPAFPQDVRSKLNIALVEGEGFGPGGQGYVRFALCAPDPDLGEASRRLSALSPRSIGTNG